MDDFNPKNIINQRERFNIPKRVPKIDKVISTIVGKDIRTTDPRLIKLIAKWKQAEGKGDESTDNSNYLENEEKIKELKETLL